jgi:hypothetical protein
MTTSPATKKMSSKLRRIREWITCSNCRTFDESPTRTTPPAWAINPPVPGKDFVISPGTVNHAHHAGQLDGPLPNGPSGDQEPKSARYQQVTTPSLVEKPLLGAGYPSSTGQAPKTSDERSDQGSHVTAPAGPPTSSRSLNEDDFAKPALSSKGGQEDGVHAFSPTPETGSKHVTSSDKVSFVSSCVEFASHRAFRFHG